VADLNKNCSQDLSLHLKAIREAKDFRRSHLDRGMEEAPVVGPAMAQGFLNP